MDPRSSDELSCLFAEDSCADIVEGVGVGEGEHLLADVFGCGFEGGVVVFGPGHPGEEVVIAGLIDRGEDILGVFEAVGADDEAVGFELAIERGRGRPGESGGREVVF